MLTNKKFVAWANENIVVLIAHNELGHDPVEAEVSGEKTETCPLYPGMTCREHCDAAVDIDTTRDEDLTRIPFIELCPNSWFVPPDGQPEQVAEADQFVAKKVMEHAGKVQKGLGESLAREKLGQILNALNHAAAAADEDRLGEALQAYAGIEKLAKKAPSSLQKLLDKRLAAIEESARFVFEDAIEVGVRRDTPASERVAAVQKLLRTVDVPVFGKRLALVGEMKAWLAKNARPVTK